jgi:hypothetical protein
MQEVTFHSLEEIKENISQRNLFSRDLKIATSLVMLQKKFKFMKIKIRGKRSNIRNKQKMIKFYKKRKRLTTREKETSLLRYMKVKN